MNKENTLKLLDAFPRLYRGRKKPITESLMAFGFECEDGWFQILWDLSTSIEALAEKEGCTEETWPEAVQVKEKFGWLRFYLRNSSDGIHKLIAKAEKKSAQTCEVCGAPGTLIRSGWWHTACVEHARNHAGS